VEDFYSVDEAAKILKLTPGRIRQMLLANVSHCTLMYLESGKREPYMPTVTKIARAYGVPLRESVGEQ
jgi:transcriptional regulator with XRE-family HTH domain